MLLKSMCMRVCLKHAKKTKYTSQIWQGLCLKYCLAITAFFFVIYQLCVTLTCVRKSPSWFFARDCHVLVFFSSLSLWSCVDSKAHNRFVNRRYVASSICRPAHTCVEVKYVDTHWRVPILDDLTLKRAGLIQWVRASLLGVIRYQGSPSWSRITEVSSDLSQTCSKSGVST